MNTKDQWLVLTLGFFDDQELDCKRKDAAIYLFF
jgi:hypothetical protein